MSTRAMITKLFPVLLGTLLIVFTALIGVQGSAAQSQNLFWGSKGEEVNVLQQKLKQWGYYHGFVDGNYGTATYKAVRDFQSKNGLRADGVVGSNTRAALGIGKTYSTAEKSMYVSSGAISTSRDVQLLARVIEGEAADESYHGKVAVGAVVMNRVKSSAFPNSLSGVIFQSKAFESVSNGQVNRPLSQESLKAAYQAMNGYDPSGGATFFWNPSKQVTPWIWSRNIINRIGSHVFAH